MLGRSILVSFSAYLSLSVAFVLTNCNLQKWSIEPSSEQVRDKKYRFCHLKCLNLLKRSDSSNCCPPNVYKLCVDCCCMYVVAQMQYDAVLEGMIKEAVVQQGWVSALQRVG